MKEKVLQLIAEQFHVEESELKADTNFVEDLNADSIELVELVMSIEDEFDVQIEDEVLSRMKTVGDVLDYVEELRG